MRTPWPWESEYSDIVPVEQDGQVTGRYVYDKKKRKMVKVSSHANVQVFDCFVPNGGYLSENLGGFIESRAHKRQVMKKLGLREAGDSGAQGPRKKASRPREIQGIVGETA